MEHAELVLSAIKDYEGENEGVRYEVVGVEMWEDLPSGLDAEGYDGETGWDYDPEEDKDKEHEVYVCVIETGMCIRQATLLRSVGEERKDGTAYRGLDTWLPKNAFANTLWSRKEQIKLLQKRFADINDDRLFFYHVRVITDE